MHHLGRKTDLDADAGNDVGIVIPVHGDSRWLLVNGDPNCWRAMGCGCTHLWR